jgi:hypothetical protein
LISIFSPEVLVSHRGAEIHFYDISFVNEKGSFAAFAATAGKNDFLDALAGD